MNDEESRIVRRKAHQTWTEDRLVVKKADKVMKMKRSMREGGVLAPELQPSF